MGLKSESQDVETYSVRIQERSLVLVSQLGNVATAGGDEVLGHALVEGEDGGGGSDLSTHVADGSHTSAGDRVNTRAEVLDNVASTTLHQRKDECLDTTLDGQAIKKVSTGTDPIWPHSG